MSNILDLLRSTSAYSGGNATFVEDLYESYLKDPESIPQDWRRQFDGLPNQERIDTAHEPIRQRFLHLVKEKRSATATPHESLSPGAAEQQASVLRYINGYRMRGHQNANLDPLKLRDPVHVDDLDLSYHKLDKLDQNSIFNTGSLFAPERMPLRDIIELIKKSYCGSIGTEYGHITSTKQKRWIQERIEQRHLFQKFDSEQKLWLLTLLTAAEGIEKYLHTRYVGQKRFSLEGGESLIPLLDDLIQHGGSNGISEVVIGMAHRGRINVLTNILGKPPQEIFDEFEGRVSVDPERLSGDVKYHMGFSSDIDTPGGIVHLVLGFNPSHLEIINPVIEGSVRARQRRQGDHDGSQVLPILIHGDSAFAGQGVVMETLNLSQTRGYSTGGTVHIITNNQIGFTTSNPLDTRSTLYCTDVAKMVQAPIFHVNGDDPEAVIFVTRLALDFRMRFHKDVVIDVICYRRLGHNEADEPAVTQPEMYKKIRNHPTVRTLYADQLVQESVIAPQGARDLVDNYRESLEGGLVEARPVTCALQHPYAVRWNSFKGIQWDHPCDTTVTADRFDLLAEQLLHVPDAIELHPRVEKVWTERRRMASGDQLIDWGFAENMAYATLLTEGIPVRLSGQDSGRGTFFHRHAVVHNQQNGESLIPLQHLSHEQSDFLVIDSLLSEEAVLGYEYGYATAEPNSLTIWEAQFGDFANGAQVVIDQFITSGGEKWGLHCGLVMLLPHGYEGQGAEHSSARPERFLRLCANHNIQVCSPTSAAQIFHLLRRQMIRPFRHPLIVMTPKSLLRHRMATSPKQELLEGSFKNVIDEIDDIDAKNVKRLIMCSGKVYYELLETRRSRGLDDVAIIRIEQLYPFPQKEFDTVVKRYKNAKMIIWCQEEPQNQGAWDQIKHRFYSLTSKSRQLHYVGRATAAAPSVGYRSVHISQQETLIDEALSGRINPRMNYRNQANQ
ncbi:MAG: 2-oxoglutarate dehydrogenase E1 component [Candidatus Thiodiazotropha sp. (ex Lucinoma annulata)]|nr:2-oxoglutarate dehydrogenase E1 component [Candidatus Thiodiazotropha sp. (ex Lucinoma borealis)]MCU7840782.1 2-oxoglutarate dehydrogenase E1 component [Candidatus Thiodiazotropha sp. (ex Troendleina suluensis)]MCU7867261.1 2-oxoglutarate dehydrogenase E1 component [Candidatus Thiodiazotropha sp. (ex Lucinoma borealis)]MCU7874555.1 2-oxoglutarate dehydrogenase E1 component [Candidatus Thiodiazotropha sp. (ex Lucinoma borealis)]MCU7883102.1 2-oxoglutarate dehydrogenase E1 component [Candidatu